MQFSAGFTRRKNRLGLRGSALLTFIFLTACASPQGQRNGSDLTKLPVWISSPPKDASGQIFGVGSGLDLSTAKRAALKDIAGKFRITIAGTVSSQVTVRNKRVDELLVNAVQEEVAKIEIKNYSLIESVSTPTQVHALIRVNRDDFIKEQHEKFDRQYTTIKQTFEDSQTKTSLEKWVILKKSTPLVLSTLGIYQILGVADTSESDKARAIELDSLLTRAESSIRGMTFYINTSNKGDSDITRAVSILVSDNGAKTTQKPSLADVLVDVSCTQRADSIGQDKLVRIDIGITVKDSRQKVIANRDFPISGASITSHDVARQTAVRALNTQLKQEGLITGLGLN